MKEITSRFLILIFFCVLTPAAVCLGQTDQATSETRKPAFKKHVLITGFISEGVAVADVNKDGKLDILAGAFWFEASEWKRRMYDVDGDGRPPRHPSLKPRIVNQIFGFFQEQSSYSRIWKGYNTYCHCQY